MFTMKIKILHVFQLTDISTLNTIVSPQAPRAK